MAKVSQSLIDIQRAIAKEAVLEDQLPIEKISKIGAFYCKDFKSQLICSAVVLEYPSMKIIETKHVVKRAPMQYIPGYRSFREGPLMLEAYYGLEQDPDILVVNGCGTAHPRRCGLATYIGVELHKPVIGVTEKLIVGEAKDGLVIFENEIVGKAVKTKEHANPLFVTPGHLVSVETAAQIVAAIVRPPHKLPEPLHLARKFAGSIRKTRQKVPSQMQKERPDEKLVSE